MRNLLQERPREYAQLHGRCRFCCDFVAPEDLRDREVLDIGCGFGWFERFAAGHAPRRLIGIEPREADLVAARSVADETPVEFVCAGVFDLPFPHGFQMVMIWTVIPFFPMLILVHSCVRSFLTVLIPLGPWSVENRFLVTLSLLETPVRHRANNHLLLFKKSHKHSII